MSWDWRALQKTAEDLKALGDQAKKAGDADASEAAYRAAISRAYYCLHHVALEWARKPPISFSPPPSRPGQRRTNLHRELPRALQQQRSRIQTVGGQSFRPSEIGTRLERLRDRRNEADYDNPATTIASWQVEAHRAVTNMRDTIALLDAPIMPPTTGTAGPNGNLNPHRRRP
jgi:hypothetical protein